MKKQLFITTFVLGLLLFVSMTGAAPANLILKLPADGVTTSTYTQDFIYSFDDYVTILNCSLIVDDEVKAVRNTMIIQNNNKISAEISAGSHTWFMKCYDSDFNAIVSEKRTFKLDVGGSVKSGYETVYNSDGTRSYVITIAPSQLPVELPAMKGGEDIRIKIAGKTYYLDVIKMGLSIDTYFVDVRDRSTNKIYKILEDSSIELDLDKDNTTDIKLYLKDVERSVNAYFIVTPYPDTQPAEEPKTPTEQPETPSPEEPETPVEEPTIPEEPEMPAEEPGTPEEEPQTPPVSPQPEPEKEKNKTGMIILIILVVLIIILLAILLISRRNKSRMRKKEMKKVAGKKKEAKTSIPPPVETSKETTPASKLKIPDDEEPSPLNEKFNIIKSTAGKKLR
jgi:hypothetical protein